MLYERPDNSFVAQFIGENNTLEGTVKSLTDDTAVVELDGGLQLQCEPINVDNVGQRTRVSVRPERAELNLNNLSQDACTLTGTVQEFIYMGDIFRTRISVAGCDDFIIKTPNSPNQKRLSPGQNVKFGLNKKDCRALDP